MSNLLSLDLSLTCTGYCVFDNQGNLLENGIFTSKFIAEERIDFIKNSICKIIQDSKISNVILEGYSYMSNGNAIFNIAELGGVIRNLLYENKIPFIVVPPTSLKKHVTGKGNCQKNLMLLMVYKKYGVEFHDDNICDAFALGKYYFEKQKVKML